MMEQGKGSLLIAELASIEYQLLAKKRQDVVATVSAPSIM
jgi:hypothetical protein